MAAIAKAQRERGLILGLSIASVVVYINLYFVQGMLPLIATQFQVAMTQASLLLSITSFSLALSLLVFAVLSDRIGRKQLALKSLYLIVLLDLLMIFSADFNSLLLWRTLQGVALAALPAVAMAYFKDELREQSLLKAGAIYIAANSLGGISGRLIGGAMSEYLSWQQAMLLMLLLSLIGTLIVQAYLPECRFVRAESAPKKTRQLVTRVDIKGFSLHLNDMEMRLIYLIVGLAFMVMVNQFSYIQLHLMATPFGWGRFEVTFIFLCYLSGTCASYYSNAWVEYLGLPRILLFCIGLMLLGAIVTLLGHVIFIFLGFLVSAFGFFLLHSSCNAQVSNRANEHRSKATALYLCSYYIGAAVGGPYLWPLWDQWGWHGVVLGVVVGLGITLLLVAKYIVISGAVNNEAEIKGSA